jgi:hypothetical protein
VTRRINEAQIAGKERCPAPRVVCRACDGLGHVELAQEYCRTYYLTSTSWEPTSVQLKRHRDGVSRTALINRLNELVTRGLVERRGNNKSVEWRRR